MRPAKKQLCQDRSSFLLTYRSWGKSIILWKLISGLVVVSLILIGTVGYWIVTAVPFGIFELKTIVTDVSAEKHAAIFEYNHGDSDADMMAVWLLEGKFTEITKDDLSGRPDLVWPLAQRPPRITWKADGRLLVEIKAPIDLRSQISFSCYSPDSEPERPYLCSNSNEIDLLVTKPALERVPE